MSGSSIDRLYWKQHGVLPFYIKNRVINLRLDDDSDDTKSDSDSDNNSELHERSSTGDTGRTVDGSVIVIPSPGDRP